MPAASLKPTMRINEVLTDAVRNRAVASRPTQVAVADSAVPTENPFYKIIFSDAISEEAKSEAFKALATFTGNKEESRELIKQYAAFEEYLQSVREKMATEIIRLQDTETFSILQTVMNNLNGQLLDFEKQMQPLTDITDAIYTLRTNDATLDVFHEIQDDKVREAAETKAAAAREADFERVREKIQNLQNSNARLSEEKALFGFGGVTKAARQQIAENELALSQSKVNLDRIQIELVATTAKDDKEPGKFTAEKAKLRELLDLTSDQHKERQKALVTSALNFVESAKRDIGEVKVHLEKMSGQVEDLLDNNTKMNGVYAIMSEGIEDAQKANMALREATMKPEADEQAIGKMKREDKKMALDDHIRRLDDAIRTTASASADLTQQTIRVKSMKDANEETLQTTRALHTQGVAGIADRLSTTLQAVSSAALGESSASAKDTLKKMALSTDRIAQRESIRVAMGISDRNQDLIGALESLGAYGEVQRAANDLTRKGLTDIHDNLEKLRALASQTQGDIHDSFAAAADATAPSNALAAPPPIPAQPKSPFASI